MITDKITKTIIDFTLGDGSMQRATASANARFKLEHSTKQRDYLWHKIQVLNALGISGTERINTKTIKGKGYKTISYECFVHPSITTAYKWCYNKGRKTIDKALLRQLDDKSLAYWFMDDGSGPKTYKSTSIVNGTRYEYVYEHPKIEHYSFSTYNCTLDELKLLQDWLLGAFNVKTRLKLDKRAKTCLGAFIVTCGIDNKDILRAVLEPNIIESMRYKITGAHSFVHIPVVSIDRKRLSGETPIV